MQIILHYYPRYICFSWEIGTSMGLPRILILGDCMTLKLMVKNVILKLFKELFTVTNMLVTVSHWHSGSFPKRVFQGVCGQKTGDDSALGLFYQDLKLRGASLTSQMDHKILQEHWTLSIQLRKFRLFIKKPVVFDWMTLTRLIIGHFFASSSQLELAFL